MSRISSTFGLPTISTKKSLGGVHHLSDGYATSTIKRSSSENNLRKSTGSLAANFNMSGKSSTKVSADLSTIEAEYIKNLQQQVYFLELEANYLREQAKKATDMHPRMTAEAERMLAKLRHMQAEVDGLQLEVKRKDSNIGILETEKDRVSGRLKAEEESHQREKRLMLDEIVQLKKEKDLLERDCARKDTQILQARDEMDKAIQSHKTSETRLEVLKNQLEQKVEQHKLTQTALDEKRTELLKTETRLREIEEKYYTSSATVQDKVVQDLRDEIRLLRQKLKETEMNADQDRYLRTKISDDTSHLVKENALLNQQVLELQKQVDRERGVREEQDTRRSMNISELLKTKDQEKQLEFELNQTKESLKHEQERCKHYLSLLAQQEQLTTSTELNASTTKSKLVELEGLHTSTESENNQLRRDKMLLVDHVAEMQKKVDEKEKEILKLKTHVLSLERRLKELDYLKTLEGNINSQKWEEFSRLAESMKTLSQTMMSRTHSPTPTPTTTVLEY